VSLKTDKRHSIFIGKPVTRKEILMLHRSRLAIPLGLLVFSVSLLALKTSAVAEGPVPSGTVSIQTTSIAAGIGVEWGDGILTYNGKQYPFSLQGIEIVGLGVSQASVTGQVYHLNQLTDFEGVYVSAEAGASAGSGPAVTAMQNPNGVVLHLRATQEGVKLTLAAQGVNIDLKDIGAGSE
jgi:hypothetical protein